MANHSMIASVTAVTKYIKRQFDENVHLQEVWMKGEISNFKWHSRGHMYLSLKDEGAKMNAVMFQGNNRHLTFHPEDGMKVIVRGKISVYEATGQYQFYIQEMQLDGIGNLYLAYEQLKEKLEKEGLFNADIKKNIPLYPKHIAVITSPTGAVIRDIFTTVKRRYPLCKLTLIPVMVQGVHAKDSIAEGIEKANALGYFDTIIVGRGGGSIEELWAFNEEKVARAIFSSTIPVISAVGHETDYTISDFVADLRAPTPTAAAEMAVPHVRDLLEKTSDRTARLRMAMRKKMVDERKRYEQMKSSYAFRYPQQLLEQKEQNLDRLYTDLGRAMNYFVERKQTMVHSYKQRVEQYHPQTQIERMKEKINHQNEALVNAANVNITKNMHAYDTLLNKLQLLSPLNIMSRGYSLSYTEEKDVIRSVNQVKKNDHVTVKVSDGALQCQVLQVEKKEEVH